MRKACSVLRDVIYPNSSLYLLSELENNKSPPPIGNGHRPRRYDFSFLLSRLALQIESWNLAEESEETEQRPRRGIAEKAAPVHT